ncbi:MAG TPA: SRPBCC family protein [Pyrinomonadaceae bacterium]|nr:SRPBCC family protein [Pyrinomonadaceae bacterium]
MIKKILLGAVVVIVLVIAIGCVVIAVQPNHYHVERSATMNAPPLIVFNQVNDFHKWDAWSPWAKLDPNIKTSFEGAPAGNGAVYSWTGNSDVGEGRMTITDSKPGESVRIKLEFIKPFAATSATVFAFKPQGNQTAVTWTMDGENNFVGKAFGLIMNMDKTIGADFEKGLAQMKAVAEKSAQ